MHVADSKNFVSPSPSIPWGLDLTPLQTLDSAPVDVRSCRVEGGYALPIMPLSAVALLTTRGLASTFSGEGVATLSGTCPSRWAALG